MNKSLLIQLINYIIKYFEWISDVPATPITDDPIGYDTLSMISRGLERQPLVPVRIPVNFLLIERFLRRLPVKHLSAEVDHLGRIVRDGVRLRIHIRNRSFRDLVPRPGLRSVVWEPVQSDLTP